MCRFVVDVVCAATSARCHLRSGVGLTIGSISSTVRNVTFRDSYMHHTYKVGLTPRTLKSMPTVRPLGTRRTTHMAYGIHAPPEVLCARNTAQHSARCARCATARCSDANPSCCWATLGHSEPAGVRVGRAETMLIFALCLCAPLLWRDLAARCRGSISSSEATV